MQDHLILDAGDWESWSDFYDHLLDQQDEPLPEEWENKAKYHGF